MNPSASDLDAGELAALLHFYADAGVEWLLDDAPIDRLAEFEAQRAAREEARTAQQTRTVQQAPEQPRERQAADRKAPARAAEPAPPATAQQTDPVPHYQARGRARFAAARARPLPPQPGEPP